MLLLRIKIFHVRKRWSECKVKEAHKKHLWVGNKNVSSWLHIYSFLDLLNEREGVEVLNNKSVMMSITWAQILFLKIDQVSEEMINSWACTGKI